MLYRFGPTPVMEDPLFKVGKVPDPALIDHIVRIGDALQIDPAKVGFQQQAERPEYRVAQIGWMYPTPETKHIYQQVELMFMDANSRHFNYDLAGFHDGFQYTVYDGSKGSHFDWHLDLGDKYEAPQRKLSMSILLSDPADYEGGDFQILDGAMAKTLPKEKGTIIIFPSYIVHRVTRVTKGTRKALVAWACGPKFR